jgi:hypothetical protein
MFFKLLDPLYQQLVDVVLFQDLLDFVCNWREIRKIYENLSFHSIPCLDFLEFFFLVLRKCRQFFDSSLLILLFHYQLQKNSRKSRHVKVSDKTTKKRLLTVLLLFYIKCFLFALDYSIGYFGLVLTGQLQIDALCALLINLKISTID